MSVLIWIHLPSLLIKDLISVNVYFACFFLLSVFFFHINFFKNSFKNTIGMSNSLDSHQAQHFVWADLGSKCLQRLAADAKINGYLTGVL